VSDVFLRVIPSDPRHVPSATARERAQTLLRRALPRADDVSGTVTAEVRFVDCGDNFEFVACPRCGADLGDWWSVIMEAAHERQFRELRATTPCCGHTQSLNELQYAWPMGFARYTLEAVNPRVGSLPERTQVRLAETLGCPIRLIWAHS
jgi:hypothetical protein